MPTVPLVNFPTPNGNAGTSNVRANPGMLDGVFNAQQRLGGAVEGIGQEGTELATRVKAATDTAYVIGAQTKLETTTEGFKAWTLEHPDTSTWGDELDARMQAAKEDVQAGAGNLGHMAKLHLTTQLGAWQERTKAQANIWQTEQSIHNAAGVAQEGINAAVANNDADSAHAIIATAVSHGVIHPTVGAAMAKRVTNGIATNQANAAIEADPFTAPDLLNAKNADGSYKNFPGLPQPARVTMLFRANKLASETRSATLKEWQGNVIAAQQGQGPMPDKESVMQEAERQGISPKSIEALFKPKKTFDPGTYADLRSKIVAHYDPMKDTDNSERAALTEQVYAANFPAQTQSELLTDIENKSKPDHVYNSPMFKDAMQVNDKNFTLGVYGKYETKVKNQTTGEVRTILNPSTLRQAEETKARVTDALVNFLKQKPEATHDEVTKFLAGTYRNQAAQAGAQLFKFNP